MSLTIVALITALDLVVAAILFFVIARKNRLMATVIAGAIVASSLAFLLIAGLMM